MKKIILSFIIAMTCLTNSYGAGFISQHTLDSKGLSQLPEAPLYPFEKFFQTAALEHPKYAADGHHVYFLKNDGNVQNIFALNQNTLQIKQITHYKQPVSDYILDPKNRFIYIQKDINGDEQYNLYRYDLTSKQTTTIQEDHEANTLCDISKDGQTIYFTQSRYNHAAVDIKKMDATTFARTTLMEQPSPQAPNFYCAGINPAETYLSFFGMIDNNEVHLGYIDLQTGEVTVVNQSNGVLNAAAQFTENALYYLSNQDSDFMRLWRFDMRRNQAAVVPLDLKDDSADLNALHIQKHHNTYRAFVQYTTPFNTKTAVFSDRFKTPLKLPFSPQEITQVAFNPKNPDSLFFSYSNAHTPPQYYLRNAQTHTKVYDANRSKIPPQHLAKSHSQYVTSFDGLQIPTHFIIPPGTSSTHKKPAILWIHGGPEDRVDPIYSGKIQYYANNGFIIVVPNVRGSTGMGTAYHQKDNGDWGGNHIKDIAAVAQMLKTLDFVQPQNIFIMGGSFGGFSTLSAIIQYPHLFKAAIDIFGFSELTYLLESWPPMAQQYWIKEMGTDPRVDHAYNQRVSPLHNAHLIKTPLQIHQGLHDPRVSKANSDVLVQKLQALGTPVEYHVYEDEGHGFSKFTNVKLSKERIIEFFKKHMQ